ncbi:hypothetical protein EJ04DRAFT_568863 [Polyplosphaeria fusca]|uniref:Uncharacterized protein n=1 Tax=Polyplosphaeria fusca TaxID=682080 RepID=A0A9P4QQU0_9PLEO|nr:hypothetical protein EJ04DRAFT_568863 [Polyplosphaeria fusca]
MASSDTGERSTPTISFLPAPSIPRINTPDHRPPSPTHYRQLISRTITQSLLDPTLDLPPDHDEDFATRDRRIARVNIKKALCELGVGWERFCKDAEKVRAEVHVLSPTRYEREERVKDGGDEGWRSEGGEIRVQRSEERGGGFGFGELHVLKLRELGRLRGV